MGKKNLIVDLDNTLSEDHWRSDFIDDEFAEQGLGRALRRHFAYHSLAAFDKPAFQHEVEVLLRAVQPEFVFVFTARPELFRHATTQWLLRNHEAVFDHSTEIYMRQNTDDSSSMFLKRKMLDDVCARYRLAAGDFIALEDKPSVLEMYRAAGVKTYETNATKKVFTWRPN